VRLAALMGIKSIFVYTHDSIFLGEDGPTHQPVEHLWAMRAIPNLTVLRPADAVETAMAWAFAIQEAQGPSALILTRQKLPPIERGAGFLPRDVWKGAYIVADADNKKPDVILLATGSELHVALGARSLLAKEGVSVRVVSVPSVALFEKQPQSYKEEVLPSGHVHLVALEAGTGTGWWKYIGRRGLFLGQETFGASAPADVLAKELGFTPGSVAARIGTWYQKR